MLVNVIAPYIQLYDKGKCILSVYHDKVFAARSYFPRGLRQPDAFRFSADALLLGAFAARCKPHWRQMLDLGCGCGAASFAALLVQKESLQGRRVTGLDVQPAMLDCAMYNAKLLGFGDIFEAVNIDLEQQEQEGAGVPGATGAGEGLFSDLIISNPPYREPGRGRMPADALRRRAMFGSGHNFSSFIRSAAMWLSPGGVFCTVLPYQRKNELAELLDCFGLKPSYGMKVFTKADEARFILLAAVAKNEFAVNAGNNGFSDWPEAVLLLHDENGQISKEATEFCPFLECNA